MLHWTKYLLQRNCLTISLKSLTFRESFTDCIESCKKNEFFYRKFDIFIGALDETNLTRRLLIASRSYFYDTLTWCVQKSQPQPIWAQIFYISKDAWFWLLIITYTTISICLVYYLQRYEKSPAGLSTLIIGGFSFFLNFCYPYRPKHFANRIYFISFMFSCMLLNLAFVTFLIKTVTDPYCKEQVEKIDDILRNDFKLVGDGFALNQLWQQEMVKKIFF